MYFFKIKIQHQHVHSRNFRTRFDFRLTTVKVLSVFNSIENMKRNVKSKSQSIEI